MKRYNLYETKQNSLFLSFSFEMPSPQQFEIVSLLVSFSRVFQAPEIWLHVKYFQIKGRGEKYEGKGSVV